MGKSKKEKFSAPKPQTTGLPSVVECEAELELEGNVQGSASALQGIIEKVKNIYRTIELITCINILV